MYFDYEKEFATIPDAYQTLIFDVMTGDQTLFVRGDEVEASWRLWDPILPQTTSRSIRTPPVPGARP